MSGVRDKDPVGRLFARLIGQLEDAAGLATLGQNDGLDRRARSLLTMRLRRRVVRVGQTLHWMDRSLHASGDKR